MSRDSVRIELWTSVYDHGHNRDTLITRSFLIMDSVEWKEDTRRKIFLLKSIDVSFCQVWPFYRMENDRIRTTYNVVFRKMEREGYTYNDVASFRRAYEHDSISRYAADNIGIGQETIFYPEKLYDRFSSLPTIEIPDLNAYLALYDSVNTYALRNKPRFSKWYGGMPDDLCTEYFVSKGYDPYRSLAYLRERDENFSSVSPKAGKARMDFGSKAISVLDSYFPWQH